MSMPAPPLERDTAVARLEGKLDALTAQTERLTALVLAQQQRHEQLASLLSDATPIAEDAMDRLGRELDELGVTTDDLADLVRAFARQVPLLTRLLGVLETSHELTSGLSELSAPAMQRLVAGLEDLERRGYVAFAKSGIGVVDRVVTSFDPEEIDQLGDNIVLILQTVKEMTQPEILRLMQRTAHLLDEDVATPSWRELLAGLREPATRRGLARLIRLLQADLGTNPTSTSNDHND